MFLVAPVFRWLTAAEREDLHDQTNIIAVNGRLARRGYSARTGECLRWK